MLTLLRTDGAKEKEKNGIISGTGGEARPWGDKRRQHACAAKGPGLWLTQKERRVKFPLEKVKPERGRDLGNNSEGKSKTGK